jgi:hypothetical protein
MISYKNSRILGLASADTQQDSGNCSRLYEVNLWLWRYGRRQGQPRTMSIDEAEAARQDRISEARSRAEETKKRRREEQPESVQQQPNENVCCHITYDVTYYITL